VPVALEDGKLAVASHEAVAIGGDGIRRRRLVALLVLRLMDVRLDDRVRRHDPSIDPHPPAGGDPVAAKPRAGYPSKYIGNS
jgi:hypothetical protein